MRTLFRILCLASCFIGSQVVARAACDITPDLSSKILEFHARQVSRIQGLLKFGAERNLCFGIQVVDTALLTERVNIEIPNPTTLKLVISEIIGAVHDVDVETHYGVIEILPTHRTNKKATIFDHVVPNWDAQRANLQVVSWLLHIEAARAFNPGTQGFAVRSAVGDSQDLVGPFKEQGLPVKYLLDKIVSQSKGGSWIAKVVGRQAEDLSILKNRSAWTVLEYQKSEREYEPLLNSIAVGLLVDPDTNQTNKRQGDGR
jgi:hypothetical protein